MIESDMLTNWGSWGEPEFCKRGTFVIGFKTKVDQTESGFLRDATALNAIELICSNPKKKRLRSKQGPWGEWGNETYCSSGFVNGFKFKAEKDRGDFRDDTAANGIELKCSYGQRIKSSEGKWGEWSEYKFCLNNYYVCGIMTQVEDENRDDTTLNNVILYCCEK